MEIREKSVFPRHKVCGEFLSPALASILDELGVWCDCEAYGPPRLERARLVLGKYEKEWRLAEPARGLSRYALDQALLNAAIDRGAVLVREAAIPIEDGSVLATGRNRKAARGARLFGFKAHFTGPADDAISLFFLDGGTYAGVSAVEQGITNVCGLAPEETLRLFDFQPDELIRQDDRLRQRLEPLSRTAKWLMTGPLVFGPGFPSVPAWYPAGDALGFVDPFTGSGLLAAVATGRLAGRAAAEHRAVRDYLRLCDAALGSQYRVARLFRESIECGIAEWLARWIPGEWLFRWTRPGFRTA